MCGGAVSDLREGGGYLPGKEWQNSLNSDGVIYTINPDGSGKTKVTNTYVSGDPIDYSPDGKKIVYYTGNDIHGKIYDQRRRWG